MAHIFMSHFIPYHTKFLTLPISATYDTICNAPIDFSEGYPSRNLLFRARLTI